MSRGEMADNLDRIGGSLINVILGALILWVGQATFRHAGLLAGIDEKFAGVTHRFEDIDSRQEGMRRWMENVVTDIKDNNRSQFTVKDGDKVVAQVRQSEQAVSDLERRFTDRLNALELKLAAIETHQRSDQEVASLKWEVSQLRNEAARAAVVAQEAQYQPAERAARATPVFLPPIDNRR